MVDYNYDDREKAKQEERIIVSVMSRIKNEINTQNQIFSKIVEDHAVGVQRVYDQFRLLGKRMQILEQEIEVCAEEEEEEEAIELDSCPFCGGPADVSDIGLADYQAQCDNCDAKGPIFDCVSDAIEAWNERK